MVPYCAGPWDFHRLHERMRVRSCKVGPNGGIDFLHKWGLFHPHKWPFICVTASYYHIILLMRVINPLKNDWFLGPTCVRKNADRSCWMILSKVAGKVLYSEPIQLHKLINRCCWMLLGAFSTKWVVKSKGNTLPELQKMEGWNTTFLLGRPIFRSYVSFRDPPKMSEKFRL